MAYKITKVYENRTTRLQKKYNLGYTSTDIDGYVLYYINEKCKEAHSLWGVESDKKTILKYKKVCEPYKYTELTKFLTWFLKKRENTGNLNVGVFNYIIVNNLIGKPLEEIKVLYLLQNGE